MTLAALILHRSSKLIKISFIRENDNFTHVQNKNRITTVMLHIHYKIADKTQVKSAPQGISALLTFNMFSICKICQAVVRDYKTLVTISRCLCRTPGNTYYQAKKGFYSTDVLRLSQVKPTDI